MRGRKPVFLFLLLLLAVSTGLFLSVSGIIFEEHTLDLTVTPPVFPDALNGASGIKSAAASLVPVVQIPSNHDSEPQPQLENPPSVIKAVYATSWSAGSTLKMNYLINLINETELNAIVIDIKDFSGFVAYATDLPKVREYHAVEVRIPKINALIKRLHDAHIYAIARVSVFQDPRLALARPDLAVTSSSTRSVWHDKKGLTWIDPASEEAWSYDIAIAKEALARGFDEINFDYVRFPSDGNLNDIIYPAWDQKTSYAKVMKKFFARVRQELPEARLSADLFGLTTVSYDDLGIGQRIENAFPYFDAIAPMVYPSHYAKGFQGFANPATHPYEVIKYSMESALRRLIVFNKAASSTAPSVTSNPASVQAPVGKKVAVKLRPWLQDFNLGALYTAEMVKAEIKAVNDAASTTPELFSGWMLWNPSNVYTREALQTTDNKQ